MTTATQLPTVVTGEELKKELNTLLKHLPDGCNIKNPFQLYLHNSTTRSAPVWVSNAPFTFTQDTNKNGIQFVKLLKYLRSLVVLEDIMVVLYYDVLVPEIMEIENELIVKIPSNKFIKSF